MEGLFTSRAKESPIVFWNSITRHLLDHMRDVGDELLCIDEKLRNQCTHLDSVVEKVSQLVALENPEIDGFEDMMELYIKKQFDKCSIETLYWDYLHTLQKYTTLRDLLIPHRTSTSEPLCSICMTEIVIMAMVPCGHTFCTNCSKKTIVCHVCRQPVTSRLRVFFG